MLSRHTKADYERQDLVHLEEETASILQRFGSPKQKKRPSTSRRNLSLTKSTRKPGRPRSISKDIDVNYLPSKNANRAAKTIQSLFRRYRARRKIQSCTTADLVELKSLREAGIHGSNYRLFRDDGTATLHLRDSISDAIKVNRFDHVPAMLAHKTYGSKHSLKDVHDQRPSQKFPGTIPTSLYSDGNSTRKNKMVSAIAIGSGRQKKSSCAAKSEMEVKQPLEDISIRNIAYPGFEKDGEEAHGQNEPDHKKNESAKTVCFNCWSARRGDTCKLRTSTKTGSASSPFCDNWGIGVVKQTYRSESIEENASTRLSALRFAKDQRRLSAPTEHQNHPLFVSLTNHVADMNFRLRRRIHVRQWFRSLVEGVKYNVIQGYNHESISKELRRRDSEASSKVLAIIRKEARSWGSDSLGTEFESEVKNVTYQKNFLTLDGNVVAREIIRGQPIPVPVALHRPRIRLPPPPSKIEIDRFVGNITSDTPIGVTTYGLFGKKSVPENLATEGLKSEIFLSQEVHTSIPQLYGGFHVVDTKVYTPEPTPESLQLPMIEVEAPPVKYVDRPLVHVLDHRRMPSIMIKTGIGPDERHFFGKNRPEQTGETEDHGFRTSECAEPPKLNADLDTRTFVPAETIVTPNVPQVLPPTSVKADLDYPFCKIKSRECKVEDLAHMLKVERRFTPNKPQIFTVMTKQEPGNFMRDCDPAHPLGRLSTVVTRSWSFVQKRRVAMFHTDDGVPYWYDRRNGQTFWERPLYDEELKPIIEGGLLLGRQSNAFVGDHNTFSNSVDMRSNIRKLTMSQHESPEDQVERKRAAFSTRPIDKLTSLKVKIDKRSEDSRPSGIESKSQPESKDEESTSNGIGGDGEETKTCKGNGESSLDSVPICPCSKEKIYEKANIENIDESLHAEKEDATVSANESTSCMNVDATSIVQGKADEVPEEEGISTSGHISSDPTLNVAPKNTKSDEIVTSITEALGGLLQTLDSDKDILKLGVGLGMSLCNQGVLNLNEASGNRQEDSTPHTDESPPTEASMDVNQKASMDSAGNGSSVGSMASDPIEDGCIVTASDQTDCFPHQIPISQKEKSLIVEIGGESTCNSSSDTSDLCETDSRISDHNIEIDKENEIIEDILESTKIRVVARQYVDYIDSEPNLPQMRPVGRIKPRSIGKDWREISFDPWSAGKDLLTIEFIPRLSTGLSTVEETLDSTFQTMVSPSVKQNFSTSLFSDQRDSDEERNLNVFSRISRCIRHGNFAEMDSLLNDSDWKVPIDYTDDVGNTLLMLCCQNGNKRMVKLCLRKGSDINKQNCNGHTCLHYAFGYGFDALGEYLISKGADDKICNADGLTCYEGLRMEDISAI